MAEITEPPAIADRFPQRQRMNVNYALACNLACDHCSTDSNPRRREKLARADVTRALRAGWQIGKRHVTFSGGEAFLFPADLLQMVDEAAVIGFVIDLETNAFWARTPERARFRLAPLAQAGASGLCLSADTYHARYYPVERTINAARAARELGMLVEINFCPSDDRDSDDEVIAALARAGEEYISHDIVDRGRGRNLLAAFDGMSVDELPDCDSLNLTVHATGDAYVCCEVESDHHDMKQTPVYLGQVTKDRPLGAGADQESLIHGFHDAASPTYFRNLIRDHPAFQPLARRRFLSICDLCVTALSDPDRVEALTALHAERPAT